MDEDLITSHQKTPSLIMKVDDAMFLAKRNLANSISDEKQTRLNTAGILEEVAEIMAEGAEVLD